MLVAVNDCTRVTDYKEAITKSGQSLIAKRAVDEAYVSACIEREADFPTGLKLESFGVAMPHGDSSFVKEASISLLRLGTPVAFGLMEDKGQEVKVSLIFHLALTSGEAHLTVLRKLMKLFQNSDFMKQCRELEREKVAQLLQVEFSL